MVLGTPLGGEVVVRSPPRGLDDAKPASASSSIPTSPSLADMGEERVDGQSAHRPVIESLLPADRRVKRQPVNEGLESASRNHAPVVTA